MEGLIKIRLKDYYANAVGEDEFAYVTKEVFEALANIFRREEHAEEMRDLRHRTKVGYAEGETEELTFESGESLEDMVIWRMELETLQKAMQSLTEVQRERLHLYLLGQGPVSRMEFFVFRKMECWKQINHLLCEWLEML